MRQQSSTSRALRPFDGVILLVGICFLILAACDGGDDPASSERQPPNALPPPADPPPVQSGTFKDSNVSGLAFVSGQEHGITDVGGRYTCETGLDVAFSIGTVSLGATECATLVMPPSFAPDGTLGDLRALNIARFLLMLDDDGDPDNGIAISPGVRQIAAVWPQVDFDTPSLDAELVTMISDAASVDGTPHVLPDAVAALVHVDTSASCAYAGAFAGPFVGDYDGAMVMLVGFRNAPLEFSGRTYWWLAVDGRDGSTFGEADVDAVELGARPRIEVVDGEPTFSASYVTPDRIAGTWSTSSYAANFDLARIGTDTGMFRFVGRWGAFRQGGVLSLSLDGTTVTGHAFDAYRGRRGRIMGSVEGEVMTLAIDGQVSTTATGTVTYAANGAPMSVAGTWSRTGDFRAVACRLN